MVEELYKVIHTFYIESVSWVYHMEGTETYRENLRKYLVGFVEGELKISKPIKATSLVANPW